MIPVYGPAAGPMRAIAEERERQVTVERRSAKHADRHDRGELAQAAGVYALAAADGNSQSQLEQLWPWATDWFKPGYDGDVGAHRRRLVMAGALIVAELERLDRLELKHDTTIAGPTS